MSIWTDGIGLVDEQKSSVYGDRKVRTYNLAKHCKPLVNQPTRIIEPWSRRIACIFQPMLEAPPGTRVIFALMGLVAPSTQ